MEGNRISSQTCLPFSLWICCCFLHAVVQQTPKYKRDGQAKLTLSWTSSTEINQCTGQTLERSVVKKVASPAFISLFPAPAHLTSYTNQGKVARLCHWPPTVWLKPLSGATPEAKKDGPIGSHLSKGTDRLVFGYITISSCSSPIILSS